MNSKPFPWLNLSLIFLFCFINHLLQVKAATGNETDRLSLMAIKDHIEGLSSWNQSMHFCQWQGITCSWRHQRVVALNLSNQNLVGTISPYVGNLSFLKSIDLRNNKFYGHIPQEIGRLFRLQHLLMRNNTFGGDIPANISQCTDLRTLNLIENKLTGNIPATLGLLSKLVVLGLQTNNLTGQIPPSLGNLSSLQIFSIVENTLEGSIPATLGKLTSLTSFLVSVNSLSGEVPLSIFNISSINIFSISANQLTGGLPLDMGITLPNLEKFTAASNQLSGPLPVSLPNACRLYNFDIANNNFIGKVPSNLGVLQYFQWINLAYNNLGSGESDDLSFITHLTNSSDLQILCLSENNFGGVFPYSIVNLSTQMYFLCLGGNQLYGTIPDEIGNLVNLIALGLENNMFNGSIPSSIGNISSLQGLFLNGNKLTGLIPSSLGKLTQLSELSLSTNRLEGSIPSSFGDYINMHSLNISRNNLSNTIPNQIFTIPSLSILLDLSHNSFTGSLPSEVGQLKSLGYIDVSGNRLSGEIPSTLANCLGLEELHMESNMFEGKIPQSLSSLKNIRYIDLSSNNLSGPIPKYLENFQSLQRLNLSFNKLEDEIPVKGIFQNASSVSVGGNFKLCGGIHELLFPTCPIKESQKEGKSVVLKIAIGSSVALFFLLASSFLIVYWRRKPKPRASSSISLRDRHIKVSYKDLFQATDGFSPTNFVGSGSFGRVYKGMLSHGEMIVAVKVFDLQHKGASKSFMAECESLRHIRHRNLVKILTSCSTTDFQGNDFKALVFEFMPNGSLEKWLPGFVNGQDDRSRNLNLLQRFNIAIDVASALNYLHHQSHVSIIHRDLKPSNILLDNDMVAHVGDFGLAKLLPGSMDNVYKNQSTSTGIKGTIGYAAPEYGMGGDASTQGDVYSYGILLLELFTGRRPTDKAFIDGLNLHNFARMALPNRVLEILDPALLSEEDVQSLSFKKQPLQEIIASLVRIGVACSLESPGERMNMEEVARDLNLTRDIFLASLIREGAPTAQ